MRRIWLKIRMPLAVIVLLIITLAMARLFSGPEDTWIKNEQGEWMKHGHPSGPPPAEDYHEPLAHIVIPLSFLIAFAAPLFFLRKHKLHNRLNFETASRDVRFFGYMSIALLLFGILVIAGLMVELGFAENHVNNDLRIKEFLIIISIAGFAWFCIVFGALFLVLKRNCNDHFQLEKSHREILEILENYSHNQMVTK